MHEMSLISFTLDAVEQAAKAHGIRRVTEIRIVVGELRMALDDQLQTAFRLLTGDRPLFEGAELHIEKRPLCLRCTACGEIYPSSIPRIGRDICPACGSEEFAIESGRELYIDSFEGDEI